MAAYERGFNEGYRQGYRNGIIDQYKASTTLKGRWEYPYIDMILGNNKIGKRIKQCSSCLQTYENNLPWDARFCPKCGSDNKGE